MLNTLPHRLQFPMLLARRYKTLRFCFTFPGPLSFTPSPYNVTANKVTITSPALLNLPHVFIPFTTCPTQLAMSSC